MTTRLEPTASPDLVARLACVVRACGCALVLLPYLDRTTKLLSACREALAMLEVEGFVPAAALIPSEEHGASVVFSVARRRCLSVLEWLRKMPQVDRWAAVDVMNLACEYDRFCAVSGSPPQFAGQFITLTDPYSGHGLDEQAACRLIQLLYRAPTPSSEAAALGLSISTAPVTVTAAVAPVPPARPGLTVPSDAAFVPATTPPMPGATDSAVRAVTPAPASPLHSAQTSAFVPVIAACVGVATVGPEPAIKRARRTN